MKNYITKNEPISSITHFIGALLSVAALVLLVVYSTKHSDTLHIVSYAIFGTTLILLYLASGIYHAIPKDNRFKKLFQKIDLSMISVLIAGTYTPIALVPLRGPFGWTLFGIIWGIALISIAMRVFKIKIKAWQSVVIYLLSGWLITISLPILAQTLPASGIFWLIAGGLSYTIGVIFFSLDHKIRLHPYFGMHDIFHLFVLFGSFSHFWLMLKII